MLSHEIGISDTRVRRYLTLDALVIHDCLIRFGNQISYRVLGIRASQVRTLWPEQRTCTADEPTDVAALCVRPPRSKVRLIAFCIMGT